MSVIAAPRALASIETRNARLGVLLIAPTVLILGAVIVYPLLYAIYLSLFSIYTPTLKGNWVGLANYTTLIGSRSFWSALGVTIVWTVGTLTVQILFGVAMALLLNQNIVFRSLARGLVLFPYFVSTVVAVLIWRWLFNDLYGILSYLLISMGVVSMPIDWLGKMPNAMETLIFVGAWKFFPFVVIAVLARLQTISEQLYEAATIDGAGPLRALLRCHAAAAEGHPDHRHPAQDDLGFQGIRPHLPAHGRRPGE